MASENDVELAERLSRRRARMMIVVAPMFMGWQGTFLTEHGHELVRNVDRLRIGAWFVWALALLALLATGGGYWRPRSVRALMNDETTRANRAASFATGFWATTLAAVGVYAATLYEALSARQAVHIILSVAVASSLISFAVRERHDHRDA